MKNQSNNLRYTATKTIGKETIVIKISLNDECKNGHQDFHITGDLYEAGKPKTDKYCKAGGCIHEDIAQFFPEYIPYIKLHGCDYDGMPTYTLGNMLHYLRQGFNNSKPGDNNFPAEFCDSYRITLNQYIAISAAKNEIHLNNILIELGIFDQWKAEAQAAIKMLESLTGLTFENTSTNSQYIPPTPEEIEAEDKRIAEGYYTAEAEEAREEAKKAGILAKLEADLQKEVKKHTDEYIVKKEVFLKGGEKALDNCIYYNHTKQVSFNWKNYDNLPVEFINELIPRLELPEGVTANISKNK